MSTSDDTPLPGRALSRPGTNGAVTRHATPVPEPLPFETTDQVVAGVQAAAHDQASFEELAAALLSKIHSGPPGGGGVPPDKHAKSIKRHNWVAMLMALLLGPGGALAVIYATSDRSKANESAVEQLDAQVNGTARKPGLDARVEQTEDDIRFIKVRVKDVGEAMDTVHEQQTAIAEGIEELKQENVTRLKSELEDARRELRRERRENR